MDFAQGEKVVEGAYVSVNKVEGDAKKSFVGAKVDDKFSVNVTEAFTNETDRASMLKMKKEELAEMDPVWDATVVNVKTFVPAVEGQETYDKIFGKDTVKTPEEIAEIERACAIGYEMHTTAMKMCRPGVTEQEISGRISGIASSRGCMVSFQSIVSMHGEIMHGYPSPRPLEAGRLLLCDAGAETNENYCSDNTRTTPISGRFTQRQKEIYSIVEECHDYALSLAAPGVKWWDVHFGVCRLMTEKLKDLGLMKGDTEEAVRAGAHAMFMPHGLGHMMGMDVHDMEGLGQTYVGFDDEVQPNLEQFGTNCLRCGRRLQEGFVMTDEPGIYFIPALIDDWKARGHCAAFLNFDMLETYKDFGGIRIEDDILITSDGCRFLGKDRIPYHIDEVEKFINK